MQSPAGEETPTILMVDDHPSNLLALEAVLDPLGHPIVAARSGEEALRQLALHDFVLVLMDVHMPGLDGYQTTALLRETERARDVPVIFLTAVYDRPEHEHRGYALGAVDYISKPFDAEVLRGKIRALVALYMRGQRAERERRQEAERLKDLFLGAVGHDLRNPLNTILLASELMLRGDGCGKESHRSSATKIERASRRMSRMIEDVLDLTRVQVAGGIPLSRESTNMADVCGAVVEEVGLARPGRALRVEVQGDVRGAWDADRLMRVVLNLVGNAVEHDPHGPVDIRLSAAGDNVVLAVHNGGTPIEPTLLPCLFEPFRRGHEGGGGLGLGLHIVREIVRAHGGSVEATSTPADGTTFTVTLPRNLPVRHDRPSTASYPSTLTTLSTATTIVSTA
jgi:signal transduction histidine kinase